jgi:hypothetical protein
LKKRCYNGIDPQQVLSDHAEIYVLLVARRGRTVVRVYERCRCLPLYVVAKLAPAVARLSVGP